MIQNYIKVSFRSLLRNKLSAATNIIGLSVSMIIGVLMFALVKSNWETDHFHPQMEQTFRILTQSNDKEKSLWATCLEPLADSIRGLSYVDKTVIVRHGGSLNVFTDLGEIPVDVTFSEPAFFEIFGFKLSIGNAKAALQDPNAVLISQEIAEKLFGSENVVGRSLKFDGWGSFQIGGIIEKPKYKTHLPVEVMFSLTTATLLKKKKLVASNSWENYKGSAIYVRLTSENEQQRFNHDLKKLATNVNKSLAERYEFSAQNIEEITPWNPAIKNDLHAGMHQQAAMTWIFLALALTLLAAFNYTALSVARIISRAKEVGIRKANGALQKQIFCQFLIESILISFFALLIAYLVILLICQSGGLSFSGDLNIKPDIYFIPVLLAYSLLTGFIAGIIPAFLLSKFKPVDVLKNLKNLRFVRRVSIYRAIIVLQFSVTIMLMIFFIVLKDTVRNTHQSMAENLPENVTILDLKSKPAELIKSEITQIGQVQKITSSSFIPVNNPIDRCTLTIANQRNTTVLNTAFIDENFVDIFNLKLKSGTNIPTKVISGIEQYALVNESASQLLGGKSGSALIGQTVTINSIPIQIIGILADQSFPNEFVAPAIYRFSTSETRFISIKGTEGAEHNVLSNSKKVWQKNYTDFSPEIYGYKKKMIADSKSGEAAFSLPFAALCTLVMLVACLGILGMANYAIQSNKISISIRKAFGADNQQVLTAMTLPFFKLLLLSGLFGIPLGWICGNLLKSRFPAHVDLGFSNILLGYGIVLSIGLTVVLSQTIRAIFVNPAKILRGE